MRRRKRVDGSGRLLKVDFFLMGVIVRFEKARGWLAVRELSRVLHIAVSLRGTEMKRKPVSVYNETTCSQSWNPGMSTRDWNTLKLVSLPLCI